MPINSSNSYSRRLLALALAASLATAAPLTFAHGSTEGSRQQGAAMHAGMYAPIDIAHLHAIADHVRETATSDQLGELNELAASARPELEALDKQAAAAHHRKIELLLQDNLDRAALEQARIVEMHAAEELSRRIDRALTDLAQILTVKQRAEFREHFRAHMR